jgi:Golgi apparatus protein 1
MNKIQKTIIALALATLGMSQAAAEETLLDYVLAACEGDLQQYCSQVTPGEGRLLHCVAAHEDKISGECSFALYEAANLLAQLADAIVDIAASCETEIDTLCSEVAAGEGRILACLDQHADELGDACTTAIARNIVE